jgi:hypothetical protein
MDINRVDSGGASERLKAPKLREKEEEGPSLVNFQVYR